MVRKGRCTRGVGRRTGVDNQPDLSHRQRDQAARVRAQRSVFRRWPLALLRRAGCRAAAMPRRAAVRSGGSGADPAHGGRRRALSISHIAEPKHRRARSARRGRDRMEAARTSKRSPRNLRLLRPARADRDRLRARDPRSGHATVDGRQRLRGHPQARRLVLPRHGRAAVVPPAGPGFVRRHGWQRPLERRRPPRRPGAACSRSTDRR